MDIRPSNIITSGTAVILIDSGSAQFIDANLIGFGGCLPHARDQRSGEKFETLS